jgi:hypothetical protein
MEPMQIDPPGGSMFRHSLIFFSIFAAAVPAQAVEPRSIKSERQVKASQGAVRLSVQSQVQQGGTIHLWFLREGGDPSRSADLLKFERKQGVPLMGTNSVDSRPLVYTLDPGRYRLLGYGVACGGLPPIGTTGCLSSINGIGIGTMPARRYDGDLVPSFEVRAGQLTDAGEFILEADPKAPIAEGTALRHAQREHGDFDVRVRPSALPVPEGFRSLAAGPKIEVPAAFVSQISCRTRPKGAMMYLPFKC